MFPLKPGLPLPVGWLWVWDRALLPLTPSLHWPCKHSAPNVAHIAADDCSERTVLGVSLMTLWPCRAVASGCSAPYTPDPRDIKEDERTKTVSVVQGTQGWGAWSGPSDGCSFVLCPPPARSGPASPTPYSHDCPSSVLPRP